MSLSLNQTKEQERKSTAEAGDEPVGNGTRGPALNRSMKLSAVLEGIETSVPATSGDVDIRQVACDSRKVQPRALFFALHGAKADENAFIRDAISRGAIAVVSEDTAPTAIPSSVECIQLREARKEIGRAHV